MNGRRLARVGSTLGGGTGRGGALERLLEVVIDELSMNCASVAVIEDGRHLGTLALVGAPREVDDLQFSLGEGPAITASRADGPLLEPDLSLAAGQWPGFAPGATALGISAAFSFQLRVGPVLVGVLTLYRSVSGDLSRADLADAVAIARITTHLLLDLGDEEVPGLLADRLDDVVRDRMNVHQATGMVAAQLGCNTAAALVRLRAHAWSRGRSIGAVADEVIARQLRFGDAGVG